VLNYGGESFRVDFLATQMGALVQSMDESHSTFRLVIPRLRFDSLIPPNSSDIAKLKAAVSNDPMDPLSSPLTSVITKGAALERSVLFATALEVWLAVNAKGAAAKVGDVLPEIVQPDAKSISALKRTDSLPVVQLIGPFPPRAASKGHVSMAKEIVSRAEQVLTSGGFMFFQSPDRAGTADIFFISADPPSASSRRNLVICAYQCKNWDSKIRPDLKDEVEKTAETLEQLKKQPEFAEFNIIPHFVLVYDIPLKCDAPVVNGMHMIQISRDFARRKTSKFENLFIFPTSQ